MRTLPHGATLLLIGVALVGCVANSTNPTRSISRKPADAPKVAQEIAGVDADGQKFHLSDYRGKVVLLDFWASW